MKESKVMLIGTMIGLVVFLVANIAFWCYDVLNAAGWILLSLIYGLTSFSTYVDCIKEDERK